MKNKPKDKAAKYDWKELSSISIKNGVMLDIPSSFQLMGHVVSVVPVNDLSFNKGAYGESDFSNFKISLQNNVEGAPILNDIVEETFCHELVHMILNMMGEEELCSNEKFVFMFGRLLHQAFVTGEGNYEGNK